MQLVIIESPLSGDFPKNIRYARLCMLDCLQRGEAPFASHLLYPQCLNDDKQADRQLGITAGFAWAKIAVKRIFYMDLGYSSGMQAAKADAKKLKQKIEGRYLPEKLMQQLDQPGYNATKGFRD